MVFSFFLVSIDWLLRGCYGILVCTSTSYLRLSTVEWYSILNKPNRGNEVLSVAFFIALAYRLKQTIWLLLNDLGYRKIPSFDVFKKLVANFLFSEVKV